MTQRRRSIGFRGRFGAALSLGLALGLGLSATVSAEVIVTDTGTHGDANIFDSDGFPGGRCGYGVETASGDAYLKWIRVLGPSVQAANRTGAVDQQKVSFQVLVQRKIGTGPWRTVASSAKQTRTAYDNAYTNFTAIKVYWNGAANQQFRAMSVIRWMRNGSVDGLVKARIVYYGVKWTVGQPDYQFTGACTGVAD